MTSGCDPINIVPTVVNAVNPQASTSAGIGVTTVNLVSVPVDGVDEAPSVTSGTVNETSSDVAQQLTAVSRGTKRSADAPWRVSMERYTVAKDTYPVVFKTDKCNSTGTDL